MFNLLKLLFSMFLDQSGEGEGEGQGGEGGGEGGAPAAGEGAEGGEGGTPAKKGEGEGEEGAGADPEYGTFGDNPTVDELYSAIQEANSASDGMKAKTTQTEKNAASLRSALESKGYKALTDGDGNITLVPNTAPDSQKKDPRFKDEHKALFAENVFEAIQFYVADQIDSFKNKMSVSSKKMTADQREQSTSNDRMLKLFPQLTPDSENFDEKFYTKATEIWQGDKDLKKSPKGELMAATQAAAELGITLIAIAKAKKDGYDKGKGAKKILGPAGGSQGAGGKGGVGRKLSKQEYLDLSSEDRTKYDREQKGISK